MSTAPATKPLDITGLQDLLQAVDPGVVLVSPRILERVVREKYALPNMYFNIPHARTFVCQREMLFRHAEQADLELQPDQLLPGTVILLVKPDAEELSALERPRLLLKYWRRLFHARVHMALETAELNDDAIRERIEQIGRTEFEEICAVLIEDRYLPAEPDERRAFIEFAAVYLELRYFAANLLANVFPGIRDFGKVERLLARDINAAELFVKTRLRDAPDPVTTVDTRSDESQEAYWTLVRAAQAAQRDKNIVRAAIIRLRASRIAPAAQTLSTRQEAEKNIAELTARLAAALHLSETETADWTRHLTLLLDKADQGKRPTEAAVLFELQNVCLAHEREVYTLDMVEWVTNLGKRPIKRPLPSQKFVRITWHLRAAAALLGEVRLSDTDRGHLARLLQAALTRTEEGLRARFAPVLVTAMEDVGLRPSDPLEKASFDKMVAELLDRIIRYGYLTFGELRDTISRNQLKLPDVSEPEHFIRGDPLIRLDRRLGTLLDGVYRPGEIYVRVLERGTSLTFGTWWGRWFTRFVAGPFLAAWVVLFVLGMIIEEVDHWWLHSPALKPVEQALMGPLYMPKGGELLAVTAYIREHGEAPAADVLPWYCNAGLIVLTGLFLMALFHVPSFRRRVADALLGVWHVVRFILWDLPWRVLPIAAVRRLLGTWVFQLLYWYVLKPAAITALIAWLLPPLWESWALLGAIFILLNLLINSRIGRAASEGIRDGVVQLGMMLRAGLIMGVFRLILRAFKQMSELIEFVLFSVDEWLRFRSGDGRAALVTRTVLGLLWTPIAFLVRFYTVVLIEPMINPLKLPVSTIAAKIVYPLLITLNIQDTAVRGLAEVIPMWLATLIVVPTIFLLPDAFGFLAWEMQENWSLYRSNRSENLRPAVVGSHGETIRGLLQPGFHSGTVPHLFARLREAEREAVRTRTWHSANHFQHEVKEVEAALLRFLARDVVAVLRSSTCWRDEPVEANAAHLATNRIRFEITHGKYPARPVEVEIEHSHYWIVAGLRGTGWLDDVSPEQRRAFATCLAGMYKLADVDLVREQMLAAEGGPVAAARLTYDGIQVWREAHGEPESFELRKRGDRAEEAEMLRRFVFARTPIPWWVWQACWQSDNEGRGHPGLPGVNELVLPHPAPLPAPPQPEQQPPAHELLPQGPAPLPVTEGQSA